MTKLPNIYGGCPLCKMKVLVIFGGTVKERDGRITLVCPFCED
jgi:transcription elongation factor Elf1